MNNLYSKSDDYEIYNGNMLEILDTLKENSVDSIVTDPPYELNFMNKGWDNAGVSFDKDTWAKCFRVLKSGGHLLAFGGSRTYHRIACAIEDAGFEIRDTIMWLYGSGFPKSMDISKQIDKRNGRTDDNFIELGNYLKEKRGNKSQKDISKYFPSKTGGLTGCVSNWEKGENMPTKEQYLKLKELLDLDNRFDYLIEREEAKREVIGKEKKGQLKEDMFFAKNTDKAKETGKAIGYGEWDITAPATDLAKQWQGWGTALKPSFEPIIVARKPFKGSLVDNVIKYGVGGINIDECRVGNETISIHNAPKGTFAGGEYGRGSDTESYRDSIGRFPANTILTYDETDFEEVCGGFPQSKGGSGKGSASRYFYCAKASKKDRDEGLEDFEKDKTDNGRNTPIDNPFQRGKMLRHNTHPTVKPTTLMQYLVRLVSPKGATILDPFMGSGSTGKAIMYENKERGANYKFIGIELTDEYLPIAKARIEFLKDLLWN